VSPIDGAARALVLSVLLRSCLTAPVLVAVLAFAPCVSAQEKEGDLERARALFDEAGELERQGQWPAAQDRLRAALRIRETANLRYALAWALENNGKLIEARTEYEVAQRLAQRAGNEEVSKLAATRIVEVDRKTPLVQVRIKGRIARDTRVLVDGRDVVIRGDSGTVPVDPGSQLVRVERAGRPPSEQSASSASSR
jgi:tetratricopeptide (TPR) repeat protein